MCTRMPTYVHKHTQWQTIAHSECTVLYNGWEWLRILQSASPVPNTSLGPQNSPLLFPLLFALLSYWLAWCSQNPEVTYCHQTLSLSFILSWAHSSQKRTCHTPLLSAEFYSKASLCKWHSCARSYQEWVFIVKNFPIVPELRTWFLI